MTPGTGKVQLPFSICYGLPFGRNPDMPILVAQRRKNQHFCAVCTMNVGEWQAAGIFVAGCVSRRVHCQNECTGHDDRIRTFKALCHIRIFRIGSGNAGMRCAKAVILR